MTIEKMKIHKSKPSFYKKDWQGFAIRKLNNELEFENYIDYETRNESTLKIIANSLKKHLVRDFDWILVNTSDRDDFKWLIRRKISSNKVIDDLDQSYNFISTCHSVDFKTGCPHFPSAPDFVYDHWRQTGLADYEETCAAVKMVGAPLTPMLGWRGAQTHESRKALVALDDKKNFDCEFIAWDRTNPEKLTAKNFLSFEEQVKKWRFLIDVEGNGYSGRLKLLLHCPRLIFIQDRKYKEDFCESLIPWRHYIPVKNDFSDLQKSIDLINRSPVLENFIISEANTFANQVLTRSAAEKRWAHVLELSALDCEENFRARREPFINNIIKWLRG